MEKKAVSKQTLQRLPLYLNFLKQRDPLSNVSATIIAQALSLNDVQVRKDLASISQRGRPKIGYITKELIYDIEQFLGYDNTQNAVIVGAGNLGRALLSYDGFAAQGLDIVAAFDLDNNKLGEMINGKQVMDISKLDNLCRRMKIRLGIITVPAFAAQEVCDMLVEAGVLGIWNFSPVHLKVPENVLVQNENMAFSLAMLSKHLSEKLTDSQE
ncbi:MAG: redox-sensing transcriptional repressor Rex [Clostridia bacterium]|nr:redox-sensing transcriptional repressor Rex [Clostridia bacterium]MBQ6905424.1 redox-sensing transcriptional repressor Rex [Clostridia bacterium]